MKKINKNIIITVLLISIIIVIAVQSKKVVNDRTERKVITLPVSICKPQEQICKIEFDGLDIELSLDKDIYYLKPFNVSVFSKKNNNSIIEFIQIDFKMKDMDMGVNRFKLKKQNSQNYKQVWKGKALLPICVTRRADWYSELEVVTRENKYIFTFPVSVKQAIN